MQRSSQTQLPSSWKHHSSQQIWQANTHVNDNTAFSPHWLAMDNVCVPVSECIWTEAKMPQSACAFLMQTFEPGLTRWHCGNWRWIICPLSLCIQYERINLLIFVIFLPVSKSCEINNKLILLTIIATVVTVWYGSFLSSLWWTLTESYTYHPAAVTTNMYSSAAENSLLKYISIC